MRTGGDVGDNGGNGMGGETKHRDGDSVSRDNEAGGGAVETAERRGSAGEDNVGAEGGVGAVDADVDELAVMQAEWDALGSTQR